MSNKYETEIGRSIPRTKYATYASKYETRFLDLVNKRTVALDQVRDPWADTIRVESAYWNSNMVLVRSAGPDKTFDTGDDMYASMTKSVRPAVGSASSGPSAIDVNLEHFRGPLNGKAVITGKVIDQRGMAVEAATITARAVVGGAVRSAKTGSSGEFTLSGLSAGEYQIEVVTSAEKMSTKVTLEPRDRAVLSAFLRHEPDQFEDARSFQATGGFGRGIGNGFAGGVVAGMPAGVGGGGGARQFAMGGLRAMPAPPPMQMMAPRELDFKDAAASIRVGGNVDALKSEIRKRDSGEAEAPRERSYFPEALYINPEIITDQHGLASISIPMADSITTWRMAMIASTTRGALGTGTSSLKVFQDFFVDLDLPVTLTQGDRVSIPVAAYNYAASRGDVALTLKQENWFALSNDVAEKTIAVEPNRVGGSQFTLEAKQIGKFKLTLSAKMRGGDNRADICGPRIRSDF